MAYDPKDPADKKIVEDLIKKAVDEAVAEAAEDHEAAIEGLKAKNVALILKNKALKNGTGEDNAAEVERLEAQIEQNKKDIAALTKTAKKAETAAAEALAARDTESKFSTNLLVENGLTEALTANKVAQQYMPAVKKLLSEQVTIKTDGDKRTPVVGDKTLGDFVKEWAASDAGKHYVTAPANGGSNAPGGQANQQTGKTATRVAFEAMTHPERATFSKEGGKIVD